MYPYGDCQAHSVMLHAPELLDVLGYDQVCGIYQRLWQQPAFRLGAILRT